MACPYCEHSSPGAMHKTASCTHCFSFQEQQDPHANGQKRDIRDVEVLSPEDAKKRYGTQTRYDAAQESNARGRTGHTEKDKHCAFWQFSSGRAFPRGAFFRTAEQSASQNTSWIPVFIVLMTTLGLGIQFGFFAGLGFLVFYGIGRLLSMLFFVRRILRGQGQLMGSWARRCVVWAVSFILTIFLAS